MHVQCTSLEPIKITTLSLLGSLEIQPTESWRLQSPDKFSWFIRKKKNKMAKKKKGGDARGYATSTKPKQNPRPSSKSNQSSQINRLSGQSGKMNVAKNSGKSTKKVQVSQSAQDQIVSLLDELKLFFATPSDTGNEVSNGLFGEKRQKPITFSVGDKKMVKKVATLVSLLCLVLISQPLQYRWTMFHKDRNTGARKQQRDEIYCLFT